MPAVITSGAYDKYEKERESKKQIAETLKAERKRKRDEKNNASTKTKVTIEKNQHMMKKTGYVLCVRVDIAQK